MRKGYVLFFFFQKIILCFMITFSRQMFSQFPKESQLLIFNPQKLSNEFLVFIVFALRLRICGYSGCGKRSNRSYFGKIPQRKIGENSKLFIDVKIEFLICLVFWGKVSCIIFLNSVRRIKRGILFFFSTSRTSRISIFFYISVFKYYLLIKILCSAFIFFSNFSLLCDFFY